jgi:hypothetical protein
VRAQIRSLLDAVDVAVKERRFGQAIAMLRAAKLLLETAEQGGK